MLAALAATGLVGIGACARETVPEPVRLRLATGPAGAVYREIGAAFADVWNAAWDQEVVELVLTDASVDNLELLLAGDVDLGLVNVDVVADHRHEMAALLRVFDSVLHIVVPEDSPISSVAGLDGRRVSLGLPGSGTRFIADRLLTALDVEVDAFSLSQTDGARELSEGTLDAFVSLAAMPTPAISWLLTRPGKAFRFLDLSGETVELQRRHPGEYVAVTISAAVYPGVMSAEAVAVATLLAAQPQLTDPVAAFLTRTVIEEAATLRVSRPEAQQINARSGVATAPIRLHPGAADYYRSIKP